MTPHLRRQIERVTPHAHPLDAQECRHKPPQLRRQIHTRAHSPRTNIGCFRPRSYSRLPAQRLGVSTRMHQRRHTCGAWPCGGGNARRPLYLPSLKRHSGCLTRVSSKLPLPPPPPAYCTHLRPLLRNNKGSARINHPAPQEPPINGFLHSAAPARNIEGSRPTVARGPGAAVAPRGHCFCEASRDR